MKTIQLINNQGMHRFFLFLLAFCPFTTLAAPTLKLEGTNGTCVSDCKITASIENEVAPVTYSLINYPSAGQNTTPQKSNVFTDLLPGTYTVGVYDATTAGVPVTKTITLTTSYVPISANNPTSSYTGGVNCAPNGTMSITFTGGKAPFRVKVSNQDPPYNSHDTTVISTASSKTAYFTGLVSGSYAFEIEDACGQWQQNKPSTSVTVNGSNYQLSNISFTALSCDRISNNSYIYGTVGNCSSINMYYYYSDLDITAYNQSTLTSTTLNPTSYYFIEFRVEYPAGSGEYNTNGWLSGYSQPRFTIANYDTTRANGKKYVVEVKHPCTGEITRSPEYTLPPESSFIISSNSYSATRTDFCSTTYNPSVTVSLNNGLRTEMITFNCNNPYTFTVKQGSDTIATKTTTGTAYQAVFTGNDGLRTGTDYTVDIAGTNGFIQTLSFKTAVAPAQPNLSTLTTYYLHTSNSYVPGYNYHFCDYNTTGIYAYFTAVSGKSVTYSIEATGNTPSITRNSITLSSPGRLWTDLPWGTYDVTANYGCGTYTSPITLTQTVSGFSANPLTYEDYATVCGRYSLVGEAYFHLNGTRVSSTSYAYMYYMLIVDGPEKIGTRTSQYGYNSSSYRARINDLPGGTYKVVFYPYYAPTSTQIINGKSVSYYPTNHDCLVEQTIVIPEYIRPVIDIPLSGGISCTNDLTNMTISITSSSNRGPFSYRYKVAGAANDTYSPVDFQATNVFTDIVPGIYTVQVKDQCGSITTQNVRVFNGNEQFVGIIGEVKPGVICEKRKVTLSVLSIGPVEWYKWYYSTTGEEETWTQLSSDSQTHVIASATQEDKGYYKVRIYNGLCELESEVHIVEVIPPAPKPSISGSDFFCTGSNTVLTAHSEIENPSFRWYKDGMAITGAYSSTYTATEGGSYTVDVTPYEACPSDQSNPHTVTEMALKTPSVVISAGETGFEVCEDAVMQIVLTATPTNGGTPSYVWKVNGTQVGTGSTCALTNLEQYRPKATVNCTMTPDNVSCLSKATATDEKTVRISSCVIPVNPHIRGKIAN